MGIKRIGLSQANKILDKGGRMFDVRDAVSFRDGTLPRAEHVALRRISDLFKLPKNTHIVIFGENYVDANVTSALNYLEQYGYTNLYNLGSKETK